MRERDKDRELRLIRIALKFGQLQPEQKQIIISMMEKNLQKEEDKGKGVCNDADPFFISAYCRSWIPADRAFPD